MKTRAEFIKQKKNAILIKIILEKMEMGITFVKSELELLENQ